MANTGDSPATILKYYGKLPEVVMRRFLDGRPVIPSERVWVVTAHLSRLSQRMPAVICARQRHGRVNC
jgi:hypothetical protein